MFPTFRLTTGCFVEWWHSHALERKEENQDGEITWKNTKKCRMRKELPNIMTSPSSIAARSFWKLGGLTPSQLGRNVLGQIIENNVVGRAAELAFYFLFSLFPLILLLMTSFGMFTSHRLELQNDFLSSFAEFLPPADENVPKHQKKQGWAQTLQHSTQPLTLRNNHAPVPKAVVTGTNSLCPFSAMRTTPVPIS